MTKKTDIIWLDAVDSTNKYVRRHIGQLDNLSVVSSLSQTSGKGQGEHIWHSEPGANLLFTILVRHPQVPANCQSAISHDTASCVIKLLKKYGIDAWIKPPNDVWVGEKKICGILIEHSLRSDRISWSIIGIGLNVNQTIFPDDLPNPTSMALEGHTAEIKSLLEEFLEIFLNLSWLQ